MAEDERASATADPTAPPPCAPPGLVHASDAQPGITRRRLRGGGFAYHDAAGRRIRQADTLARIARLAIPPAYEDVWICPDPLGHLQATGRDARGRKQYRYHALWRAERDSGKFERLAAFGQALPALRRRVHADLAQRTHCRERVLATIVHLLDTTFVRVGNDQYARENGSFGLTTLRARHVRVQGDALRLRFRGKSGVEHDVALRDARVARVVRGCLHLPGQELFRYQDADGMARCVGSADVNAYLQAVCGERFTAKDFRTWHGSVLALEGLAGPRGEPFTLKAWLKEVAGRLGNTPAVCRKAYIHPRILAQALARCGRGGGAAPSAPARPPADRPVRLRGLRAAELRLLGFLLSA